MGVRFTGMMSSGLMFAGALIKWYALKNDFGDAMLWGMNLQVVIAALGFSIFGMGAEITGITVSKVIVKWFAGKELALAMGLQVAMARIGTAIALAASLPIARMMGDISGSVPYRSHCPLRRFRILSGLLRDGPQGRCFGIRRPCRIRRKS